jgi:G3E family GTPase
MVRSIMSQRIPVVIISGYLGAGKTTLLRHVIPQMAAGSRVPYVILNDVMNAEVDSALLREVAEVVRPISGGCICCDSSASLIDELERIPVEVDPIVLIEANGTTDPYPLIELLTLDTVLAGRFGPVYQVAVINECRWQKRLLPWDRRIERAQAATASHLVFNRGETATPKQRQRLVDDLEKLNPNAVRTTPEDLAGELANLSPGSSVTFDATDRIGHEHHHLAVRLELPPMREDTLRKWLTSFPSSVLRIKGLVSLVDDPQEDACFFQRTDDEFERPNLIKTRMPGGAESCAVFIGNGLDETRIRNSLHGFCYNASESSNNNLPPIQSRSRQVRDRNDPADK